jgi:phosphodiesterase/alkaline phosphatase D-like protein
LIVTIAPPAGGPDVTGVTASGIGAHRATISWTTGQPADGQVDYGPTNLYGLSTLLNPALSTTHARTLTGLLPGTTYHFRVTSKNGQGAATTSGDLTFVTIGPPVISSITVSSVTIDSATIQWTTDQASTSVVRFGAETGDVRRAGSEALVTAHRVALQNLSAGRTYHFRVTSRNAEELDTTSADLTFTTPAPPPPTFRGVASLGITPDQATIAWTTDRHTRARVEYGTTAGYGRRTEMDDEFRLTRTDRLSGLTPNTTYHFRVCVVSRDGQWALSPDLTFKTPPAPPKKDDRERHRGHKHGPEGDKDCDRKNGR